MWNKMYEINAIIIPIELNDLVQYDHYFPRFPYVDIFNSSKGL